jgi:DNA-binding LytR/AlgR family response regulator
MGYSKQIGEVITLNTKTEIRNIPLDSILYFECDGSLIQVYHTENDTINYFIGTLKKLETEYADYGFLRISHNRLVNMRHMVCCRTKTHELNLKNKFFFKVSRRKWHLIKDLHKS